MSSKSQSKLNFLSSTDRRLYKRKKPSYDFINNDTGLSKIVKVLNSSSSIKKINKFQLIQTQTSEQRFSYQDFSRRSECKTFNEAEFIKKQLKAKLQILFRKSNKKWRVLLQSYEDLKSCSNAESYNIQQNKFFLILTDLLKMNIEDSDKFQTIQKSMKMQPISINRKQKSSLKINLQKIKLMKQNQTLRQKYFESTMGTFNHRQNNISQFQFAYNSQQTVNDKTTSIQQVESSIKLRQLIKQLNQKIYQLENQNIQLKQRLVTTQDSFNLIKDDRQELSRKVAQLKVQNENFCSQFVLINLENQNSAIKLQRWRSIISFQREQILSYETQLISIKDQHKDLMRKYKILVKKINNVATNSNSPSNSNGFEFPKQSQQFASKYGQIFKEQVQSFHKIRATFYNKESQNTLEKPSAQSQKRNLNNPNLDNYKNYLNQKQTISNPNGIKKLSRQYYVYFKPNFYNFVESYMDVHGIDPTTMDQLEVDFQLNSQFLVTIRAILDSKFNDFLNQNFSKSASLPNFTYAWLSKFKVHKKQKKIVHIKEDLNKDIIPKFFINLMSQRLNCSWQIIAFREFLMQSLTLDELYFYLMARHFIFQSSLLQNISAVYQQVCYINIVNALNLMQKFIPDVNYRRKIQEYIKKYIIYIRKQPLIDAHFLLRILLEYYQSKKHQQHVNLSSLADLLSKDNVLTFSFDTFMKIFQYNFVYLSMTDKIEIYKKSFSCSRGKITLQSILTVLSEEGYFCKNVKKIFCNDQIIFNKGKNKNNNQTKTFQSHLPEFQDFEKFFEKFYKQYYEPQNSSFGLEEVQMRFNLVKQFDQTSIFQRIGLIFNFCFLSLKKLFYSKKLTLSNFLPIMQEIVYTMQTVNKFTCIKKSTMNLMAQFKRDSAARKILRFYKKKRNQMHRNFILGVKDDVFEEDLKMNSIKNEFASLIQNLKDKFSEKGLSLEKKKYQF